MIAVLVFFGGVVAYFIIRNMSKQPTLPVQIAILIGCILGVILFIVGLSYLFGSVYSYEKTPCGVSYIEIISTRVIISAVLSCSCSLELRRVSLVSAASEYPPLGTRPERGTS